MTSAIKKVTLAAVKKSINQTGQWSGYMVANNVNQSHVNTGWHIGAHLSVKSLEELDKRINEYIYYNGDAELWRGKRYPHYYIEVK